MSKQYALSTNAVVFSSAKANAQIVQKLGLQPDQYIVTLKNSRERSRVISKEAASWLKEFSRPTSLAEAALRYAKKVGQSAEDIIQAHYEMTSKLIESEVLIDPEKAQVLAPSLALGTMLDDYEVEACIQLLPDTEVYRVRNEAGELAALKVAPKERAPSHVQRSIKRESIVLEHLSGAIAPKLIASGEFEESPYILMEWIGGGTLKVHAETLRLLPSQERFSEFKTLILKVLRAYATLHARSVTHADIHPNNVLFTDDGEVKLIDFSLSHFEEASREHGKPRRNLVAQFRDPKLSSAIIAGEDRPQADSASDQYALGALLYLMFTGTHYIDFSLEREVQLREVLEKPVRTFEEVGVAPWQSLEMVLGKMLEKEVHERFSSLKDAFEEASRIKLPSVRKRLSRGILIDMSLYGTLSSALDLTPSTYPTQAPSASVNFGAAGTAWGLWKLSILLNSSSILSRADMLSLHAESLLRERSHALQAKELGINEKITGGSSLLHSELGVYATRALVCSALSDVVGEEGAIERFIETAVSRLNDTNFDATLGLSSLLLGISSLLCYSEAKKEEVTLLGDKVFELVKSRVFTENQEINEDIRHLGLAHGRAGAFYALLRFLRVLDRKVPQFILSGIDTLGASSVRTRLGSSIPRKVSSKMHPELADNSSLCNGSAGHVMLFAEAHLATGDPVYLELAKDIGKFTYLHPDSMTNMCCGLSGRALSLISLFRASKDEQWSDKAKELSRRSLNLAKKQQNDFSRYSVIKGEFGVELVDAFFGDFQLAEFPFYG